MQAGIIGLGAMGTGMARNLARSGYLTSLWNRTPDKAHTLAAELSIEAATSIQQLASSVDIIMALCEIRRAMLPHEIQGLLSP